MYSINAERLTPTDATNELGIIVGQNTSTRGNFGFIFNKMTFFVSKAAIDLRTCILSDKNKFCLLHNDIVCASMPLSYIYICGQICFRDAYSPTWSTNAFRLPRNNHKGMRAMTESKNRVADSSNLIDSGRGFSYKFKDNKLMIVVDLNKEKETYSSSYNSKKFCNTEFKGQNIGMLDGKYKLMLNLSVFRDLDWGSEEATSVADQRAEAKRKAQSYKR